MPPTPKEQELPTYERRLQLFSKYFKDIVILGLVFFWQRASNANSDELKAAREENKVERKELAEDRHDLLKLSTEVLKIVYYGKRETDSNTRINTGVPDPPAQRKGNGEQTN